MREHGRREEEAENAREAAMILRSAVFREAFDALDERIVGEWRDARSPTARERLHARQAALAEVRAEILRHIENAARREAGDGREGPFRPILKLIINSMRKERA